MTMVTPSRGMVDADADLAKLKFHEDEIARSLIAFFEVGNHLIAIKADRLYKAAGYSTFDEYCRDRWQIGRGRGYQLMTSAAIYEEMLAAAPEMSTGVDILPTHEGQLRPLAGLNIKEMFSAWADAVKQSGGLPTRTDVEAAVERLRPKPAVGVTDVGPCMVCGQPASLAGNYGLNGDPVRCVECIAQFKYPASPDKIHGAVSTGSVSTGEGVAVPPTAPSPVELQEPGEAPHREGGDGSDPVTPSPGSAIAGPAPTRSAVDRPATEAAGPAAASVAITPDAVIPPKPKPVKPTVADALIDDYVKNLRQVARSFHWWLSLDDLTERQQSVIFDRLTEDEGQWLHRIEAMCTGAQRSTSSAPSQPPSGPLEHANGQELAVDPDGRMFVVSRAEDRDAGTAYTLSAVSLEFVDAYRYKHQAFSQKAVSP